ncbi:MAG: DUF669 domain-containing protein [Thiolinea sp.]
MATLPFQAGFDANTVEPQADLSPVPAGEYIAVISESEMKPTRDGAGQYLQIVLTILDEGQFKGRKIWDRLNLVNDSQTAVEIAQRTLSAICHATGVLQAQDSVQLHDKPMKIKVAFIPASTNKQTGQTFNEKNEVKAYKKLDGAMPVQSQSQPAPAVATTSTTQPTKAAPWAQSAA